jgi:epsin
VAHVLPRSQQFNEIMPCIYSQFMEKEARQWRQIYKVSHRSGVPSVLPLIVGNLFQALQLLEYLIKHGSERVVDDARSHVSTLKMLRSFHYIDEKGKDQGVNGSFSRLRIFRLFNTPAL